MPLDRSIRRILDMLAVGQTSAPGDYDVAAMRRTMRELAKSLDPRELPIGRVEDHLLPGPGGPLPVRCYTPSGAGSAPGAGLVYFHGGVGVFGSVETHDAVCRMLAEDGAMRVVSIDYRLAPEHPFPAALADSWFATNWVAEQSARLGIDRSRLAVGGDSAGGTLAAVVCQMARAAGAPSLAAQLLLCPVTDLLAATPSRAAYGHGYFLSEALMQWALDLYCPSGTDRSDARLSPLRAASFAGLPCAHIHTAEFDLLRDEGAAYAEALEHAGVEVHYRCHAGLVHHFYGMAGAAPAARSAVRFAGEALRTTLGERA